ncbi:hypothetical protein, partial [Georgenia sunbinii]|uniref:hypothetical protein n=1 Tax=Georgenia sunbinii TaxID=3117728 RepID=UPI002F2A7284
MNDHSIVAEFLRGLRQAVPQEIVAPPVILTPAGGSTSIALLPEPAELLGRPLEEIRALLNSRAVDLLQQPGGTQMYQEFIEKYDEVVHRAWYTPQKGEHALFGYTLHEHVARGAFGRVYRATAPNGDAVAVKVLKSELSTDMNLLQSFRRGVQAMRLLESRNV